MLRSRKEADNRLKSTHSFDHDARDVLDLSAPQKDCKTGNNSLIEKRVRTYIDVQTQIMGPHGEHDRIFGGAQRGQQ